jgi:ATP-dependent RNA helicase DBP3
LTVTENSCPYNPILKFEHVGMSSELAKYCSQWAAPTPIQAQVFPIILSGADCIGIASTGSGKTLGFGLPGLLHVKKTGAARPKHPVMLVISPTRELAVQTALVCSEAGACMNPPVECVCVFGGVAKGPQTSALRKGVHIVVATPGRLFDLMEQGEVFLDDVSLCCCCTLP